MCVYIYIYIYIYIYVQFDAGGVRHHVRLGGDGELVK